VSAQRKEAKERAKSHPHNIILEILIKLPTSTGLPSGRALKLGTVKGEKKKSLSVYSDWQSI